MTMDIIHQLLRKEVSLRLLKVDAYIFLEKTKNIRMISFEKRSITSYHYYIITVHFNYKMGQTGIRKTKKKAITSTIILFFL
jgi:hypothetical protein